jgi:hypothetical protein
MSECAKYLFPGGIVRNIFELDSITQACSSIETIRAATDEAGFSIIKGMISKSLVGNYLECIRNTFDPNGDIRISGAYKRESQDFQRLDLGEFQSSTRFARYFFFFPWNDNFRQFDSISRPQMNIFNLLAGHSIDFGLSTDSHSSRFRSTFVIQYPLGGGFMSKHREYSIEKDDKAYVVYLALTTKGVEYSNGGAYVFEGDKLIEIEEHVQASDIVIYRGDRFHGVSAIDRDKALNVSEVNGRMILTTQVNYFKS